MQLELESVRRFEGWQLDFSNQIAICGANGSGKTTIVEAIRLLSVGKSLRTSRLDEIIRFDGLYCKIKATIQRDKRSTVLEFFYGSQFEGSPKERRLTKNDHPLSYLASIGELPTVLFVPSDLEIILGSPSSRRRYLDSIFWQCSAEFRQSYLELQRVLRERTALLFLIKRRLAGLDELQPWNELLAGLTKTVQDLRQSYVGFLSAYCLNNQLFKEIELTITYQPNVQDFASIQAEEIRSSQNQYGPQRDELEIKLNGRVARQFASRGQARLALVMLKRAELAYLLQELTNPPLFLLDDVLSELDGQRASQMLEAMDLGTQKIMTCLDPSRLLEGWQQVMV